VVVPWAAARAAMVVMRRTARVKAGGDLGMG
jgi:hypothetical protein